MSNSTKFKLIDIAVTILVALSTSMRFAIPLILAAKYNLAWLLLYFITLPGTFVSWMRAERFLAYTLAILISKENH